MRVIVGLGNPGSKYAATRHNIGFRVVDEFASRFRINVDRHEKEALTGRGRVGGGEVLLAKPQTFMNRSGDSVSKLVRAHVEVLDELIVVYDEIDLPLGKIRIRERGSPGTHNGMRSIVTALASDAFPRLRCGIDGETRRPEGELSSYVLEKFDEAEKPLVQQMIGHATDALLLYVRGDLRRAMNEFNREAQEDTA